MERRRRLATAAAVAGLAGLALLWTAAGPAEAKDCAPQPRIKNVIVMISDGMGYNQMLAGDYFQYGATGKQVYQHFPLRVAMSTYSAYGSYDPLAAWGLFDYAKNAATDSASAATAMSTGVKNQDGVIGIDVNGQPLYHATQRAEVLKKSTGVVTSVEWSHATPAAFVAHNISRSDYEGIAKR